MTSCNSLSTYNLNSLSQHVPPHLHKNPSKTHDFDESPQVGLWFKCNSKERWRVPGYKARWRVIALAKWAVKEYDLLTGNNLKSEWVVYAWVIGIPELDEKIWIISLAATDSCTSNSYQAYVRQELPNSTTHNQLVHFRKDPFIAGAWAVLETSFC